MKKYCFGVDIGGTTVKLGLFESDGTLREKWEIPTNTTDHGKNIIPDICKSLDNKMAEYGITDKDIEGVGMGLPGPVLDDGTVLGCVNLGWDTFNVPEEFSNNFHGIRVKAGNDANVAALGESFKGGGSGYDDIVMIPLGTGVGGGVIIGGKILTGYNGAAGEIGHMHVEDNEKEQCGCGKYGCLEQYASATGVARLAKRYMKDQGDDTKMRQYGDKITSKDVFDLAKAGDEGAIQVVDKMAEYLGRAMAMTACVLNPQAFIIGGGVSRAGEFLIKKVEDVYRRESFTPCGKADVLLAKLGNDAGIYGAAALILRQ